MNEHLPENIREAVKNIKAAILQSQYRAAKGVNKEQLSLYFGIGRYVSEHSRKGFWGTGAIERISEQLQKELPGLRGFGARQIKNMRSFYEEWQPTLEKSAATAAKLPKSAQQNRPLAEGDLKTVDYTVLLQQNLRILDSEVKKPFENPSIGIILCKDADKGFVEFLIQGYENPMGVATYKTAEDVRKVLPPEEELRKAMDVEILSAPQTISKRKKPAVKSKTKRGK